MRHFAFGLAVIVSSALLGSRAEAGRGVGGPCVEDARRLCAGVSVVGGKLQECLKQHINELSATCRAQVGAQSGDAKGAASAVKEACSAEVSQLCKGVSPVGGALQKCIKENSKNLSEGCRNSVGSLRDSLMPR